MEQWLNDQLDLPIGKKNGPARHKRHRKCVKRNKTLIIQKIILILKPVESRKKQTDEENVDTNVEKQDKNYDSDAKTINQSEEDEVSCEQEYGDIIVKEK
jgi:hypothetical protein